MIFRGWLKTSLVEYPDRVATVLFTGGCQFRCPYCYNPDLVLRPSTLPAIDSDTVLAYLSARPGRYQAVHLTGGEPTLHLLEPFARACRGLGLEVGLATNGAEPDHLARLLERGLVSFVAMDVKNRLDPDSYARACGVRIPGLLQRIRRSVELIRGSGVSHELRTTVLPAIHRIEDLRALALEIRGAERYVLQQFVPRATIGEGLSTASRFTVAELEELRNEIAPLFGTCEIRNTDASAGGGAPVTDASAGGGAPVTDASPGGGAPVTAASAGGGAPVADASPGASLRDGTAADSAI